MESSRTKRISGVRRSRICCVRRCWGRALRVSDQCVLAAALPASCQGVHPAAVPSRRPRPRRPHLAANVLAHVALEALQALHGHRLAGLIGVDGEVDLGHLVRRGELGTPYEPPAAAGGAARQGEGGTEAAGRAPADAAAPTHPPHLQVAADLHLGHAGQRGQRAVEAACALGADGLLEDLWGKRRGRGRDEFRSCKARPPLGPCSPCTRPSSCPTQGATPLCRPSLPPTGCCCCLPCP